MAKRIRRLWGALVIVGAALLSVALASGRAGQGVTPQSAALAPPTAGDSFEPELGMPATQIVMIGASLASGEVWAYGNVGAIPAIVDGKPSGGSVLLEHTEPSVEHAEPSGWQVVPLPPGPGSQQLSVSGGILAGRATSDGGVAVLTNGGVVTRDPEGQPTLLTQPEASLLGNGESLPPESPPAGSSTAFTAVEDPGHTGVLIAPYGDGAAMSAGILAYDGEKWTREPIEGPSTAKPGFAPEALACGAATGSDATASSPTNCWLLAEYKTEATKGAPGRLALFRRVATGVSGAEWQEETVEGEEPLLGELKPPAGESLSVTALGAGTSQMLTVTSQGVWVDFLAESGNGGAGVTKLLVPVAAATAKAEGTWCYPAGRFCSEAHTLGASLPPQYRSFAWPGAGGKLGTRIITGLGNRAMLEFAGDGFSTVIGAGGEAGPAFGAAAFSEPDQGWIADGAAPTAGADGQGQSQVIHVTSQPSGDQLKEEAVPFRRPLYAVAQAPGSTPGDPAAQALAVGELGEIARYVPGQGWRSESLYNAAGEAQTPTLRAVAWPSPGRAYAVGDNGAMWLWQADTGLWVPDPGKPLSFIGNLAAIAFSPANPNVGYAVGRQGVLLRFGKGWEQEPTCGPTRQQLCLAPELTQVNFTSVTFAGTEALASYRALSGHTEVGGLAVREGSGPWHVDPGVTNLLSQAHLAEAQTVLSRVAGLPDGGVVAAGPGLVIERDSTSSAWRLSSQPLPEAQNISALAAYREPGGSVRAIVSIDLDPYLNPELSDREQQQLEEGPFKIDLPPPSVAGQPPVFLPPDLLPNSGYVLKETASGWVDMEHEALPVQALFSADMPARPDPVLALLVAPSGASGLAVGGQTDDIEGLGPKAGLNIRDIGSQTAAAMRFPAAEASSNGATSAAIDTTPGEASFAIAGQAACVQACADFVNDGLGPEVWLKHALASAGQIATGSPGGLRAFLYTGSVGGEDVFSRDLARYEGALPAYGPDNGASAPGAEPGPAGTSAYSFVSTGDGGKVEVIVLGSSAGALEAEELRWLQGLLENAKKNEKGEQIPAIVMGTSSLAVPQGESSPVAAILVNDGASAYFFDSPESNVHTVVSYDGKQIPAYGTGTIGYVAVPQGQSETDSLGLSGYLLAEVDTAAHTSTAPDVAPYEVTVRVVPNVSQLALYAPNGVFLRRSQVALFEALARRPPGGVDLIASGNGGIEPAGPDPYDQIPFNCLGANCAYEIPTEYTFSSSNPEVGGFVAHEPASANPSQVLLGAKQLPVSVEPLLDAAGEPVEENGHYINQNREPLAKQQAGKSGIFCAFNPGTTTVSITTGGLTYSEPVTVQAGSVEYPCGTVPLRNPPPAEARPRIAASPVPVPTAETPPASPLIQTFVPPPPLPVRVHPKAHPLPPAAALPFVVPPHAHASLLPTIVPPPAPFLGRPIPPSGTSQVVDEKREEESAQATVDTRSAAAVYDPDESRGVGPWPLLALIVIAAGAGTGVRRGRRQPRPALALASQRRRRQARRR
jgi:hypothetical protein